MRVIRKGLLSKNIGKEGMAKKGSQETRWNELQDGFLNENNDNAFHTKGLNSDHSLTISSRDVPSAKLEVSEGLNLRLLSEDHPFIRKFVLSMITNIPFKNCFPDHFSLDRLNETLLVATVFFSDFSPELHRYFERIKHELELGVCSPYHAARILEMKAFSMDEKRALIQDRVLGFIHRFPKLFDYDLFSEMQQFFLSFSDEYFRVRSVRGVTQTLMALYVARKRIKSRSETFPKQRHVEVKIMHRLLNLPLGSKGVLEIVIGMNILRENELFKKKHLLKAVQSIIPEAKYTAESDYLEKEGKEALHLIALEVEKKGGFNRKEVIDLKRRLARTVRGKVEHLQRTLFMPRNEEEILKHVVTLGRELRFPRDLPQVILSFEKQTETKLLFTVILARLLLPKTSPLQEMLLGCSFRPKIDRIKQLGMLRKKYPKEAAVFKVDLPLKEFLREDQSIDLYLARESVLKKLRLTFGQIRDYNGGMLSKQNEIFKVLEKSLGSVGIKHHRLLRDFFYALFPVEKQSFLDPKILKNFFLLLLEKMQTQPGFATKRKGELFYIVADGPMLNKFRETSSPLIGLDIEYDGKSYRGLVVSAGLYSSNSRP